MVGSDGQSGQSAGAVPAKLERSCSRQSSADDVLELQQGLCGELFRRTLVSPGKQLSLWLSPGKQCVFWRLQSAVDFLPGPEPGNHAQQQLPAAPEPILRRFVVDEGEAYFSIRSSTGVHS